MLKSYFWRVVASQNPRCERSDTEQGMPVAVEMLNSVSLTPQDERALLQSYRQRLTIGQITYACVVIQVYNCEP